MKKLFLISGFVFAIVFAFGINAPKAEAKSCKKGHVCYSDSGCGNFNIGNTHYGGDQRCAVLGQNCPPPQPPPPVYYPPVNNSGGSVGTVIPTPVVCTPKLACSGTKIVDGCNPDKDCVAVNGVGSTCNPTTLTCTKSAAQIYIETNGGTNLPSGQVVIKDFKANTINPYNSTNGTGGNCSPVFNLLTEDKYSTCTLTGSAQGDQTYTYPILSPKTFNDSKVTKETQYKLTCGENLPNPITGATTTTTGTSTKYATCYINASFSEVNP